MIEAIRVWLTGVLCTAILAALAERLSPQCATGKISRMAGGILLLIATVRPVLDVDLSALASASIPVWEAAAEIEAAEADTDLIKTIIGEQTGAYILDKAEAMGIPCSKVTVTCEMKDNVPYPAAVHICGQMGEEQRRALSGAIEAELAIPEERQTYESEEQPS